MEKELRRTLPRAVYLRIQDQLRAQNTRARNGEGLQPPKGEEDKPDTNCPWADGWRRIKQQPI